MSGFEGHAPGIGEYSGFIENTSISTEVTVFFNTKDGATKQIFLEYTPSELETVDPQYWSKVMHRDILKRYQRGEYKDV